MFYKKKIQPIINKAEATKELGESIQNIENTLKNDNKVTDGLLLQEQKTIKDLIEKTKDWIEKNPKAKRKEADEKQQDIENQINPLFNKARNRADIKDYIKNIKNIIKEEQDGLNLEEKSLIDNSIKDIENWIQDSSINSNIQDIKKKKENLIELIDPILNNAKSRNELFKYATSIKEKSKIDKTLTIGEKEEIEKATNNVLNKLKENKKLNSYEILQEKKKN